MWCTRKLNLLYPAINNHYRVSFRVDNRIQNILITWNHRVLTNLLRKNKGTTQVTLNVHESTNTDHDHTVLEVVDCPRILMSRKFKNGNST